MLTILGAFDRRSHHGADLIGFGHIQGPGLGGPAGLPDGLRRCFRCPGVEVSHGDMGTLGAKDLGGGAAHAGTRPGDEGDGPLE